MASTRKYRSVNRRYFDYLEFSPSKSVSNKSGRQKRKLSDILGSPWTDEEVECFYKAYRKYGEDWKKVAAMVRTRNCEMVETLYTMNKAYLSLPEGTASVAGFVAMVSDHYNVLERSNNDQEIKDFSKLVHKSKKHTHQLLQHNGGAEDQLQFRLAGSSDWSLPQLKRRESDGCTVRKRTPRFSINQFLRKDNSGNYVSLYGRSQMKEADDVGNGVALALTEDLQRGGFPQVSQSPYHMKTTPLKLGIVRTKLHGNVIDEDCFEGSSGSGGAENVTGEELYQKGRKFNGQKDNNEFDDGGEACSGTGVHGIDVADENIEQSSSHGKRKRNKKLLFRDDTSSMDALQTLVDLSMKIQFDSHVLKEDKPPNGSTARRRHKTKAPVHKEKSKFDYKLGKSKSARVARVSRVDYKALSEGKQLDRSIKCSSFEAHFNEKETYTNKVIGANEDNAPSKICNSTRLVDYSSSNSDASRTGAAESAVLTALLPICDGVDLPSRQQSKFNMNSNTIANHGGMKLTKVNLKEQHNKKSESQEHLHDLKDKAFGYLSSSMVRRWSTYEWFYSAIDYPWFAKREFVEYIDHIRLGHIPRLTKVEWGLIRSSLGKPRRFSKNFLHEEREELWQYRESVRKHYTELRSGTREGLPMGFASPLVVGQRVIALHPDSREVHDGSVLSVDHDKYRIQFDHPELGIAFVRDIDCMPLNLLDNLPEAFRRENSALYRFSVNSREPRLPQSATGSLMLHTSSEQSLPVDMMTPQLGHDGSVAPVKAADNVVSQHAAYAPLVSQIQTREADIRALSELARALDKKEAILKEIKLVNDCLMNKKNETGMEMKVTESFRKEYAIVLLKLKEASSQVTSAVRNLRQRNTYSGNLLLPWQKLQSSSVGPMSYVDNFSVDNQLTSNVVEIVNNS